MKTAFYIAKRYLFSKKSTNAINIISFVSMIGMGLGAAVLVVLLSVFNGFVGVVVQLQSSFYADIEINKIEGKVFEIENSILEQINNLEGVEAYCLVLEENAYISYENKSVVAKVRAYDENFDKVNDIGQYIIQGEKDLQYDNQDFALLGAGVFRKIEANSNQTITIAIPKKGKTTAINAAQLFNTAQIFPGGVFGIQNEFDNAYILTSLSFLRKLQGFKNEISSVEIKLNPGVNEDVVANNLLKILGPDYKTTTRIKQNQSLYKAMQAEKFAMIAILFLVLLIISFTIVGALSMLAMEKRVDISILKAMGASKKLIFNIFLLEGILGSLIGATIGAILGLLIVLVQQVFGIIKLGTNGGFVIDAYPVNLEMLDVLIAFILIIIISFLASWFPAKRAANSEILFVKY